MTGPLCVAGQLVHCTSIISPAFTGASTMAGVAFRWQTMSGPVYAVGATKVFLGRYKHFIFFFFACDCFTHWRSFGIDHPTTDGAGFSY